MKHIKQAYKYVLLGLLIALAIGLCAACGKTDIPTVTVRYAVDGGGYIQGQTEQTVEIGGSADRVMAVPNEGHSFSGWSDGSLSLYRFDNNITEDLTVTATFMPNGYFVQYTATQGGYLTGASNQNIGHGKTAESVTAVAQPGYRFVGWSDGLTAPERQDTVTASLAVCAEFEQRTYRVEYIAEEGGYIEGDALQELDYGSSSKSVTAKASENHKFIGWSDGKTAPTRQDIATDDLQLIARFAYTPTHTLQYKVNEGGSISGETMQIVPENENAYPVLAKPNTGYVFVGWSDGFPDAERIDLSVADKTVIAYFRYAFDGQGTREAPYQIDSYRALEDMRQCPDANFILICDLDLSGIHHAPLFDNVFRFRGTFDGNGHTIQNLTVDTGDDFASLFGFSDGDIFNLNITDADITVSDIPVSHALTAGIVCGVTKGMLSDIHVSGTIHAIGFTHINTMIGGIAGIAYNTVQNCSANVSIQINDALPQPPAGISGLLNIGGLIGETFGNVLSCSSSGEIVLTSTGTAGSDARYVGGLIGIGAQSSTGGPLTIIDCNSDVAITTQCPADCGGLLGYFVSTRAVRIENCHTSGNVDIIGGSGGGFAYYLIVGADSVIQDCSAMGNVTADNASGFVYTVSSKEGMSDLINCFSTGTVQGGRHGEGFASDLIDVKITACHSSSQVTARDAVGFVHSFYGNMQYCYATGNITNAYMASGFINSLDTDSTVAMCYSTGTVQTSKTGAAFLFINRGSIINCYSSADVVMTNETGDTESVVCGLTMVNNGTVRNCYYSGKISGTTAKTSRLAAIAGTNHGLIKNCHWLYAEDALADKAVAITGGSGTEEDIIQYTSLSDMYMIADLLNGDSDDIWVNVADSTPQFNNKSNL